MVVETWIRNTENMNHDTIQKMDLLHAKQLQFKTTVAMAKQVIHKALQQMKKPYVSFSGGKDSLVMLHLVLEQRPSTQVVYFDADASYPDTDRFLEELASLWNLNFCRIKTTPIIDVFREYGINHPQIEEKTMAATVYAPVAQMTEQYGCDGEFVGLRSEESIARRQLIRYRGQLFPNKSHGSLECLPVAHFSTEDIWAYITSHNLPYNAVYDRTAMRQRNEIRVSYWCGESAREFGRYVWLKKEYPELYNRFAAEFPEVREWS